MSVSTSKRTAEEQEDRALLESATAGDVAALHRLIGRMYPVMWSRIKRKIAVSLRHRGIVPEDAADMVQHAAFLLMWRGRLVLNGWRPDGGMSVRGFFGLFAERAALSWSRSGRLSGWAEFPVPPEVLEQDASASVTAFEEREALDRLWSALHSHLGDRGIEIFRALLIEGVSVSELCARYGLTPNAVYCARRRYRALAKAALAEHLPSM